MKTFHPNQLLSIMSLPYSAINKASRSPVPQIPGQSRVSSTDSVVRKDPTVYVEVIDPSRSSVPENPATGTSSPSVTQREKSV